MYKFCTHLPYLPTLPTYLMLSANSKHTYKCECTGWPKHMLINHLCCFNAECSSRYEHSLMATTRTETIHGAISSMSTAIIMGATQCCVGQEWFHLSMLPMLWPTILVMKSQHLQIMVTAIEKWGIMEPSSLYNASNKYVVLNEC